MNNDFCDTWTLKAPVCDEKQKQSVLLFLKLPNTDTESASDKVKESVTKVSFSNARTHRDRKIKSSQEL